MAAIERRYRIEIVKNGATVLEESSVRCQFYIERIMALRPSFARVSLYSPSIEERNANIADAEISIYAGDAKSGIGLLFRGKVTHFVFKRAENAFSRVLNISESDGEDFLQKGFLSFSIAGGLRVRDLISVIATSCDIPLQIGYISPGIGLQRLGRGRVCFGLASDELRRLARSERAVSWVKEGKLYFVSLLDDIYTGNALVTPETGMLGVPQLHNDFVTVSRWLDSGIMLNMLATVNNNREDLSELLDVSGRVFSVNHVGDTHDGEWKTMINVLPFSSAQNWG